MVKEAVRLGNQLITEHRSWKGACEAMRAEWFAAVGNHLEGLESEELDGVVDAELLEYARKAAREGVAARVHPFGRRVRAKPHRSAVEHVEEGLDKLWKDAHRGRVLLFSGEVEQYLDGVVSSPFARVASTTPTAP